MINIIKKVACVVVMSILFISTSVADDSKSSITEKIKKLMNTGDAGKTEKPLIFTAPPRNSKKDDETYLPIVEYLSKTLHQKIEYRKPSGWGDYTKAMINDEADIVFDGPHFNAWRMNNLGHRIIVRLPQQQFWKIIVEKSSSYKKIEDLTGRRACLQGATNYGKLRFMQFFPNVMRLPQVVQIGSRRDGYNAVINGQCAATILTEPELGKYNKLYRAKHDNQEPPIRVLVSIKPSPNQAFSVSARLSRRLQDQIQEALLSPQGQQAMAVLRDRYANNKKLVAARQQDYQDIDEVLAGSYPFDNPFDKPITEAYSVGNDFRHRKAKQKHEVERTQTAKQRSHR
jgi:ABC-type phosphate/phosphonate transport system substrate-binding protein